MSTATQFVDCSSNNPMPNMAAYAKAGHKHICRKVSEGTGYRWYEGDTLVSAAHAHGVHVGNYHWLRPDQSAVAQANMFAAAVKPTLKAGDWLMTDFERTYENGQAISDGSDISRARQLADFNHRVQGLLPGYPLYVYTGNWYLDGKPHMQAECRNWPIVMSDYSGAATLPNPYRLRYVAWQFTDRATVPGFSAHVDYNRWLITPAPHPLPAPNLLEWIMTLPGAPKGLTYSKLVDDIATAAAEKTWTQKIALWNDSHPSAQTVLSFLHKYIRGGK